MHISILKIAKFVALFILRGMIEHMYKLLTLYCQSAFKTLIYIINYPALRGKLSEITAKIHQQR